MGAAVARPGADTEVLGFIAESLTALAGFELAAISIVEGDELRTVAVAGDPAATEELMQLVAPVADLLAELEPAEEWGRLRFLPHEREPGHLAGFEWVPDVAVTDDPGAWHPRDLLCALLADDAGRLRGLLSVDLPRDRLRPTPTTRHLLNVYAEQAERAVVAFLERGELEHDLEAERELSRFRARLIGQIAHELKAPVAVVLGNTELALDEPDPQHLRHHLDATARGARRISRLADDLLHMAQVDDPDVPLDAVPVDIIALVRETVALVAEPTRRRQVDVAVVADGTATVAGDAHELETLVLNLLSNAVKYSDAHSQVTLGVAPDVDAVVLTVADTGLGIPAAELPHVFEEFFRSASPDARHRPGTGLGLAIVDRIVRRHHGTIEVASTLGAGTTFTVRLPRSR